MIDLKTDDEWERILAEDRVVIYKHSPICALSLRALPHMRSFEKQWPEVPVYQVNVIRRKKLAGRIAEDLDVRHESPQVIVLNEGRPAWHASHFDVTAEGLAAAMRS
jgi:bacillithiol system protein YtxJ